MSASPPLVRRGEQWQALPGFAYGLHQPVLLGNIFFSTAALSRLSVATAAIDQLLELPPSAGAAPAHLKSFYEYLLACTGHIQRDCQLPLIGDGQLLAIASPDTSQFRCQVALPYWQPKLTLAALGWVLGAADSLLRASSDQSVRAACTAAAVELETLRKTLAKGAFAGVNTRRILRAAIEQDIPFQHLEGETYIFGQGHRSRWLRSTFTDMTGLLGADFAQRKHVAAQVLARSGLPVAEHLLVRSVDEAVAGARKLGFPVVIKPADKDGGVGVHAGLQSESLVRECYAEAARHSQSVLVEKYFEGADYRLTVLHGQLIKAIQRIPGGVTGDGAQTIRALIDRAIQDPTMQRRSRERGKPLLALDREALQLLDEQGLTPDSAPAAGQFVRLRRRANVSTGGTTRLVTSQVHPDNRRLAERAALALRLDVAGIDLIIPDIGCSWLESGAIICEVNAQPQLGESGDPGLYGRFLRTLLQGDGCIPVALILCPPSVVPAVALHELAPPHAGDAQGVVCASAGTLRLDNECLARSDIAFFRAAQAALNNREAKSALLAATVEQIVATGLPCQQIDVLLVLPAPDNAARNEALRTKALAEFLLPHVGGEMIFLARDSAASALAAGLPLSQRLPVARDRSEPALHEHLMAGGVGVWTEPAGDAAPMTFFLGSLSSRTVIGSFPPDAVAADASVNETVLLKTVLRYLQARKELV